MASGSRGGATPSLELWGLITAFCNIGDLHCWRQCSRWTLKCVRRYFKGECGEGGLHARMREFLQRHYPQNLLGPLWQFVREVEGAFTGSAVVKMLTADPTWQCRDIDIIACLNKKTIASFARLVNALAATPAPFKMEERKRAFEAFPSWRNLTGAESLSCMLWMLKLHDSLHARAGIMNAKHEQGLTSMEEETENFRSLLAPIHELTLPCQKTLQSTGYNKHVRTAYFSLHLLDPLGREQCTCCTVMADHTVPGEFDRVTKMNFYERRQTRGQEETKACPARHWTVDVLLVPEPDVEACGGLFRWMSFNFDFQICVNAVWARRVQCLAPADLMNKVAILRADQYCFARHMHKEINALALISPPVTLESLMAACGRHVNRQDLQCHCGTILPARILKYGKRGYRVQLGAVRRPVTPPPEKCAT